MNRLELVASIGSSLVCVVMAAVLLSARDRRPLQTRFAWFVLSLGTGIAATIVDDQSGSTTASFMAFLMFAVFPLTAGLFVEAALSASLPTALKVALIAGLVTVPLAYFFVPRVHYLEGVALWQLAILTALLLYVAWHARIGLTPARRATARALLIGSITALLALGNDWAASLNFGTQRVGRAGVVLVLFVVTEALFDEEHFRLRRTLLWLAGALSLSCAAAALVDVVTEGVAPLPLTATALFLFAVGLLPIARALSSAHARAADTLRLRLADVDADDVAGLVAELRRWPEVRAAAYATPAALEHDGLRELPSFVRAQPGPHTAESARWLAENALSESARLGAEQAAHFCEVHDVDLVARVGEQGSVIGVGFTALAPGAVHREAVRIAATMARMLEVRS